MKAKDKNKVTPMAKTKLEQESAEMLKAKKAKELYHSIEEKQKSEGYRWVTGVCERGIKKQVWTNK